MFYKEKIEINMIQLPAPISNLTKCPPLPGSNPEELNLLENIGGIRADTLSPEIHHPPITNAITQEGIGYSELMGALLKYGRKDAEIKEADEMLFPEEEPQEIKKADQDIERQKPEKPGPPKKMRRKCAWLCCLPFLRCLSSTIKTLKTCCSRAKTEERNSG